MSRWFRVYDDLIDDPKVQRLSGDLVKAMLNLWCLASKNGGRLPPIDETAFKLRMTEKKAGEVVDALISAGLIDEDDDGAAPHNWSKRQFKSDVSNERVKRHRERKCNVTPTVTVTPTDTETDITSLRSVSAPAAAPEAKREKIKAHRLPDDWQPDREAAVKVGLPVGRIDRTAEKFRDYWLAQGGEKGRKVDWLATWRNWCRNEADRLPASERAVLPASAGSSVRLSMDTPDADRARHFIETGFWWQWWGPPPGDEDCYLPKHLQRQCLEARSNQHLPKDEEEAA